MILLGKITENAIIFSRTDREKEFCMSTFDVVVIGGGPAGMMAAARAAGKDMPALSLSRSPARTASDSSDGAALSRREAYSAYFRIAEISPDSEPKHRSVTTPSLSRSAMPPRAKYSALPQAA